MRPAALLALVACSGPSDSAPTDSAAPALDLEGAHYELHPGGLVVRDADEGLSELLRLFFVRTVLLAVHDVSDTEMSIRLGFALDGSDPLVGDPCMETIELPPATITGTSFEIGPADTTFEGEATDYTIGQMHVQGAIGDGGDALTDLVLSGTVDLRQAEGFGTFGDADGLCETTASLGKPCEPCADGEAYCLALVIEGLTTSRVEATLAPRTAPEASCTE